MDSFYSTVAARQIWQDLQHITLVGQPNEFPPALSPSRRFGTQSSPMTLSRNKSNKTTITLSTEHLPPQSPEKCLLHCSLSRVSVWNCRTARNCMNCMSMKKSSLSTESCGTPHLSKSHEKELIIGQVDCRQPLLLSVSLNPWLIGLKTQFSLIRVQYKWV